jgi:hypothetical protein
VRTFCQRRTLGSWHTRQRRSYFSVALPFNWWIWGIDIQLEADIDDPQLQYFEKLATHHARQKVGDHRPKLIIVTAEPAWAYCGVSRGLGTIVQKSDAFENLKFFLKETVWKHGIDLRLVIAGDLHHYARYSRESRPGIFGAAHLVTAGGGGAYLSATHHLHGTVRVPVGMTSDGKTEDAEFCLNDRRYPSESKSLLHSFGCLMLPLLSPSFALLMALTYVLLAWQLQSGSRADCVVPNLLSPATEVLGKCWETPLEFNAGSAVRHFSLMDALTEGHSLLSAVQWQARAFQEGPSILVTLLILWFLLYAFCDASSKTRFFLTTAHLFSHVLAVSIGVWTAASVVPWVGSFSGLYSAAGSFYAGVGRATVFGVHMFVYGAIVGPLLFAAYLWLSAHCVIGAPHMNEVFSSRRFQDCKHFLRFHLQPDGRIHAVVVGVEWVSRLWRVRDDGEGASNQEKAWYQPLLKPRTHVVDTFWLDFEDRSGGATAEAGE